jgi:V8-like Glu-specific endopeptidase
MKMQIDKDSVNSYYTLRFLHSDNFHKVGEQIAACNDLLRIGQQKDCEVTFENSSKYEDELFAVIRPLSKVSGWQLITSSEFIHTRVNGVDVQLVHYLKDGDRISFDDDRQELLFNVHQDEKYSPEAGIVHIAPLMSHRLIVLFVTLPIVLFGILSIYVYRNKYMSDDKERNLALTSVQSSILQISVDSVYYVMITPHSMTKLNGFSYANDGQGVICGTAFVTTDSLIVTARHCIEPWLNDSTAINAVRPSDLTSKPSKWAMMAETYNMMHRDTIRYAVISKCSFTYGEKGKDNYGSCYWSSDFVYDNTRDDIVEKGDFFHQYFWRSLLCRHEDHDMMLGDIAYLKTDSVGKIGFADECIMNKELSVGVKLTFMGYPDYQDIGLEQTEGEVKLPYRKHVMIAHDGNLNHGYSGGPVLIVVNGKAYAVGVISVTDKNGDGRRYSVPVSERKRKGGRL